MSKDILVIPSPARLSVPEVNSLQKAYKAVRPDVPDVSDVAVRLTAVPEVCGLLEHDIGVFALTELRRLIATFAHERTGTPELYEQTLEVKLNGSLGRGYKVAEVMRSVDSREGAFADSLRQVDQAMNTQRIMNEGEVVDYNALPKLLTLTEGGLQGVSAFGYLNQALTGLSISGDPRSAAELMRAFLTVTQRLGYGQPMVYDKEAIPTASSALVSGDYRESFKILISGGPIVTPVLSPAQMIAGDFESYRVVNLLAGANEETTSVKAALLEVTKLAYVFAMGVVANREALDRLDASIVVGESPHVQKIVSNFQTISEIERALSTLEAQYTSAKRVKDQIAVPDESNLELYRNAMSIIAGYGDKVAKLVYNQEILAQEIVASYDAIVRGNSFRVDQAREIRRLGEYMRISRERVALIAGVLQAISHTAVDVSAAAIQAGDNEAQRIILEMHGDTLPHSNDINRYVRGRQRDRAAAVAAQVVQQMKPLRDAKIRDLRQSVASTSPVYSAGDLVAAVEFSDDLSRVAEEIIDKGRARINRFPEGAEEQGAGRTPVGDRRVGAGANRKKRIEI